MQRSILAIAMAAATVASGCNAYCQSVSPADCAQQGSCAPIDARPVVSDGEGSTCVRFDNDPTAVGCQAASIGCGDAITFAANAEGERFWFPSTCVPEGFTVETGDTGEPACE